MSNSCLGVLERDFFSQENPIYVYVCIDICTHIYIDHYLLLQSTHLIRAIIHTFVVYIYYIDFIMNV